MDTLGGLEPAASLPAAARDAIAMEQAFSFNTLKKLAAEPNHTDVSLTAAERVRALSKMGYNIDINQEVTPRRYFRSGVEMERMAAVYLEEGSLENAYVLYNKFITLFVEKLPGHRDYPQCSVPEKQVIMRKLQEVAFPRKDQLKKLLHEKYSKEHNEYLKRQAACVAQRGNCGGEIQQQQQQQQQHQYHSPHPHSNQHPHPNQHHHPHPQHQHPQHPQMQLQRLSLLEEERQRVAQLRRMQLESEQFRYFEDQLRRQEEANRRQDDTTTTTTTTSSSSSTTTTTSPPPSVTSNSVNATSTGGKVSEQPDGSCLSQPGSKNHVRSGLDPNRNKTSASASNNTTTTTTTTTNNTVPQTKPAPTLAAVQNQRVDGLRRVLIPRDLTHCFLLLADSNTARGIETCGVLCGKLTHNEFVLTHVIVPKQSAGPDYCDMENVEELFRYQDRHSLLTLGWIHTHPTQTAFLSSVDLHTHCSYQLMLPEAIAIVCAPKHNDTGVFRLTSSGMGEVAACRLKGFHPHSKDPAFIHYLQARRCEGHKDCGPRPQVTGDNFGTS